MEQMVLDIEVREQSYQPVVSIRTTTDVRQLPNLIGESYMKIIQYLGELDVEPVGPPFVAYYNMDMENLDVEIGYPVDDVVPGDKDMCPGEIEKSKVVSCMYKGPYVGMVEAYDAMNEYINEKGLTPKGTSYEVYYNSPDEVASPDDLLTRIDIPIL